MSVWHSPTPPRFTDANGRFELPVASDVLDLGQGVICVVAEPETEPYLVASTVVLRQAGSEPITVDFDLVRGIPVRGVVTTPPGTKPPRAGRVEYYPLYGNTHAAKIQTWAYLPASSGVVQPDRSYQLVVFPGPGAVAVSASPKKAFAAAMVEDQELDSVFHDGKKHRNVMGLFNQVGHHVLPVSPGAYKAVSLINPDEGTQSLALDIEVQPGVRVCGLLSDPDGRPVTGVAAAGLTPQHTKEILEGPAFEVLELNPEEAREVVFLHREKKLGRILTVRGDETGPLEVRLERCGTITGRIVDHDGMAIRNGPVFPFSRINGAADTDFVSADKSGRFEQILIPRKKYSFAARLFRGEMANGLKEITLEPGQTLELGDVFGNFNRGRPPDRGRPPS
jgi:hypothetical protein